MSEQLEEPLQTRNNLSCFWLRDYGIGLTRKSDKPEAPSDIVETTGTIATFAIVETIVCSVAHLRDGFCVMFHWAVMWFVGFRFRITSGDVARWVLVSVGFRITSGGAATPLNRPTPPIPPIPSTPFVCFGCFLPAMRFVSCTGGGVDVVLLNHNGKGNWFWRDDAVSAVFC